MKWNRRVIIPFYHHGKIVGYTGRKFNQGDPIPKYFSNQPEHFMYNQDQLESDDTQPVFIMEGILDAISIGGVATLKNNLTPRQMNLMERTNRRKILIPDRNRAGERLLNRALEQGWEVSIPDWDRVDDVASATKKYGKLYTMYSIMEFATDDPVKIRTRFNILKSGG
jgi:DNA primase